MLSEALLFAVASYAVMVWAFLWSRNRFFHIPVMVSSILIDVLFPVYLVLTKDWYRRLIEQGEILSFMIWMHLILVLTLYALYFLQVQSAIKLIRGDENVRGDHRNQGKGILIARGLVILSSSMLIEPVGQG